MAFLPVVLGFVDSNGDRVDAPSPDGGYLPNLVKVGSNLAASSESNGSTSIITLDSLGDATSIRGVSVSSAVPTNGQSLIYDSAIGKWKPATPSSGITVLTGDVTATGPGSAAATVARLQGTSVATTAPTNGQVLTYDSTTGKWTPSTPSAGSPKSINTQGINAYGPIAAGTPVCPWGSSDGAVVPATSAWGGSYTAVNNAPIGIATNTTSGGDTVEICSFGECTLPAGIASIATPVFVRYGAGVVVPFGSIGAAGSYRVIRMGTMISSTKLFVCITDLGQL